MNGFLIFKILIMIKVIESQKLFYIDTVKDFFIFY